MTDSKLPESSLPNPDSDLCEECKDNIMQENLKLSPQETSFRLCFNMPITFAGIKRLETKSFFVPIVWEKDERKGFLLLDIITQIRQFLQSYVLTERERMDAIISFVSKDDKNEFIEYTDSKCDENSAKRVHCSVLALCEFSDAWRAKMPFTRKHVQCINFKCSCQNDGEELTLFKHLHGSELLTFQERLSCFFDEADLCALDAILSKNCMSSVMRQKRMAEITYSASQQHRILLIDVEGKDKRVLTCTLRYLHKLLYETNKDFSYEIDDKKRTVSEVCNHVSPTSFVVDLPLALCCQIDCETSIAPVFCTLFIFSHIVFSEH